MIDPDDYDNATLTNATFFDISYNATFCEYEQPFLFQSVIYFMYAVIFVVATLGNGIVCYIVISSPRMRTVTNYFITNLAVGDLLITVFCVPFTSVSYLKQYWEFGSFLCPVVNYFQAVAVFVSSYTLVAISIDRYMAIMWPLRPRMTKRIATLVIMIVWIISMMTVVPILVFSKLTQPNEIYEVCGKYICREDWSSVGATYEDMYTKALALFQFIVPLSVFIFTYTSIAVVIWCHRIPGEAENCRDQRIAKSKRKMVKMMVTVVFIYTMCWLPFNVFWILENRINQKILVYLWFAFHGLAMSHACYNPIIYCYMNSRFRAGILQTLLSIPCCRRCLTSLLSRRTKSSTTFPLTSLEGTDTTLLQRDNTYTTYVSMKRPNGLSRMTTTSLHQAPVRSASVMRSLNHTTNVSNNSNHLQQKNYPYTTQHVLENQM